LSLYPVVVIKLSFLVNFKGSNRFSCLIILSYRTCLYSTGFDFTVMQYLPTWIFPCTQALVRLVFC